MAGRDWALLLNHFVIWVIYGQSMGAHYAAVMQLLLQRRQGPCVRQGEGREVRRLTLLNVECAREQSGSHLDL